MNDDIVKITLPLTRGDARKLKAGRKILLSGEIYTLRDAGHKRFIESITNGKPDFDVTTADLRPR